MNRVAQSLGRPGPSRRVRPWMAGLAWRLFALAERLTGRRSMATKESLASANEVLLYDGTKIERILAEIGEPWSYTPLDDVISTTARAYRREFGS